MIKAKIIKVKSIEKEEIIMTITMIKMIITTVIMTIIIIIMMIKRIKIGNYIIIKPIHVCIKENNTGMQKSHNVNIKNKVQETNHKKDK